MQTTTIPLSKLRPGTEFPGAPVNMRSSGKDDGIAQLATQIRAEIREENPTGLIQSLLVCPAPENTGNGHDAYFVIDGDRRLAALRKLVDDKAVAEDVVVPVTVRDDLTPGTAMALSIAANSYLPPHPIDRFEAFAGCAAQGMTVSTIASRFGVGEKLVKQSLALGTLSPKIRQLWRDEKISTEAAQAFTITSDHALQDAVYAELSKSHNTHAYAVRRAIAGDTQGLAAALTFVGRKAYKAAGGEITQDLFESASYVSDRDLLNRMVADKLGEEVDRLKAEGWSWVKTYEEIGGAHQAWQYQPIEVTLLPTEEEAEKLAALRAIIESDAGWQERSNADRELDEIEEVIRTRSITSEDRGRSGCIVAVSRDGELEVRIGVARPRGRDDEGDGGDEDGADLAPPAKPKKQPGDLAWAVRQSLSEQLTLAARDVVAGDPQFALAVIIATMESTGSPCRLKSEGFGRSPYDGGGSAAFAKALETALGLSPAEKLAAIAVVAGGALDLTLRTAELSYGGTNEKGIRALADALAPAKMGAALRERFDAADFFARASAQVAEIALKDMGVEKPAGTKKKADLATFAAQKATEEGWLPKDLRTAHYDGPGSKAKPAGKGKAKSTPKPRKRAKAEAAA